MNTRGTIDRAGAIVLAAGQSRRFGVDKLFVSLHGKPVLQWTIESFLATPSIRPIVVVFGSANFDDGAALVERLGAPDRLLLTRGGARRQDSVAAGLKLLVSCDWVVVHDGARPLVTPAIIEEGLAAAQEYGAALAAVPVTDTIKDVDAQHTIVGTLDRSRLWAAQTPQVFRTDLLRRAHAAAENDVTDDAMLIEQLGQPVTVFVGRTTNIKITTPDDLALASALLAARESTGMAYAPDDRVGTVHASVQTGAAAPISGEDARAL